MPPCLLCKNQSLGQGGGGGENELFAGDQSEVCAALEGREQGWSRREVEEEGRDVLINV